MGREVKRVPLDFDWPMNVTWPGYLISMAWDTEKEPKELSKKFADISGVKYDEEYNYFDLDVDPPTGDGWQMWEDTSEGSAISPVFATPEELARWLADTNASAMGDKGATYDQWLSTINAGYAPSMVHTPKAGLVSGVEFIGNRK